MAGKVMMTLDEFFAEAKRLKCRMLPDDPADVRAIIDAKDAEIEALHKYAIKYGDQRAAEAREQMREECVKLIDAPIWLTWDVRAKLITLIRKLP